MLCLILLYYSSCIFAYGLKHGHKRKEVFICHVYTIKCLENLTFLCKCPFMNHIVLSYHKDNISVAVIISY